MEVWVLDAGVFSSHSLYMYEQRRNYVGIYYTPEGGRRWYEKPGGGGEGGNESSIMSRIFLVI